MEIDATGAASSSAPVPTPQATAATSNAGFGEGGASSSRSPAAMPPAPATTSTGASSSSSSAAMPPAPAAASIGGSSSSTSAMPQAGRPHSLQPPAAAAHSSDVFSAPSATAQHPSAAAASAQPQSSVFGPERDRDHVEAVNEPFRPKENPKLSKHMVKALENDDFLLGKDLANGKLDKTAGQAQLTEPRTESFQALSESGDQASAVDKTFAQLDVALRQREYLTAEALWKRMLAVGAAAMIPERPDLRDIAKRYVSAMCTVYQDELENAIERKDVTAAERQHQRLCDLRDTCRETRLEIADGNLDRHGRNAELEARYQQLCNRSGPLVCNLFPRVTANGCMTQGGQESCTLL